MATRTLDAKGLSCPQPVLKLAAMAPSVPAGDIVEVLADCATFPDDVRKWCEKLGKVLVSCTTDGGIHKAQIQF